MWRKNSITPQRTRRMRWNQKDWYRWIDERSDWNKTSSRQNNYLKENINTDENGKKLSSTPRTPKSVVPMIPLDEETIKEQKSISSDQQKWRRQQKIRQKSSEKLPLNQILHDQKQITNCNYRREGDQISTRKKKWHIQKKRAAKDIDIQTLLKENTHAEHTLLNQIFTLIIRVYELNHSSHQKKFSTTLTVN